MYTFKINPCMEKLAGKPAVACYLSPNPMKGNVLYNQGRAFECALGAHFFGKGFAEHYAGDNVPRQCGADLPGTPFGALSLKTHNATLGAYRPQYSQDKLGQVDGFLADSIADNYAYGVELASGKWQVFILSKQEMTLFLASSCWVSLEKGQRVKQRKAPELTVEWLFNHFPVVRL